MIVAKKALTSGQAAKLLGVAPRTVAAWMTKGYFPNAYHLPPGNDVKKQNSHGDRRIPVSDVIDFIRKNKIPAPKNLLLDKKLILVDSPSDFTLAVPFDVEVVRGTLVTAAKHLATGGAVCQLIVWPGTDGILTKELAGMVPKWCPPPILVMSDDGMKLDWAAAVAKSVFLFEIDWKKVFEKMHEACGVVISHGNDGNYNGRFLKSRNKNYDSGHDRDAPARVGGGEVPAGGTDDYERREGNG